MSHIHEDYNDIQGQASLEDTELIDVIAKRLKTARLNKGFNSCREFALKNGLCARKYQRHENGENKIDLPTLIKYCEALDISILWLQTGDERYLGAPFIGIIP